MVAKTNNKDMFHDSILPGRYGGILLHPTSLPNEYGIGDLGPELYRFIDYIHKYKLNLWQILPLGPTGYADSPYQSLSAFAGNPMLISPQKLIEMSIITSKMCEPPIKFPDSYVDYGEIIKYKWQILETAFQNFQKNTNTDLQEDFNSFINEESFWLEEYSLFMSIKLAHNLRAWIEWEQELRFHEESSIEEWKENHRKEILFQKFTQFLFFTQWKEVKTYSNQKNIKIIGDIPIFVAYDSVDVWANPEYYQLNEERKLKYVAGVPPDYFSETGQRWGNPLYNWDIMKKQGYSWWIQRIKHSFKIVDILRIDHFRGFESYWQIPAKEETAIIGEWVPGPGIEIFTELKKELGDLAIIAEDLGTITTKVEQLLQDTGFPGMRVLHFAFEENNENPSNNKYLPHNFNKNSIVYTGTHDNQTTKAWFDDLNKNTKKYILAYTASNGEDIVGDLIRLIWSSVAKMAVIPLQDLLRLGEKARMNVPGTTKNNWIWRFTWDQFSETLSKELEQMSKLYNRLSINK